jgi:hypothetical protein
MTSTTLGETNDEGPLDEQYVQDAFHSYLKSSLAQAKAERLLDVEVLSSAEGDLMITGPALCLFFAALRCTTNPPSVPLPRTGSAGKSSPRLTLSLANCPATFVPFMRLWSECVPAIQGLTPERQHDLARVICALTPLETPAPPPIVARLAADLRSIGIEISLRRSFQDRYASDLQAAIDVGEPRGAPDLPRAKASFVPPPMYTPSPATTLSPMHLDKSRRSPVSRTTPSPTPPLPPRSPSGASTSASDGRSPTIAAPTSPAIELIRETLYAALADVLASTPRLHAQLTRDPPRAYYGSVALAILAVGARSVAADSSTSDADGGAVWLVRGRRLTVAECPAPLRPLMREFVAVGVEAARIEEEDTMAAIALVQEGREVPVLRLERARLLLECGVGYDVQEGEESGRRSAEGRAVAFANRVNALALSMTRLPQFKERQAEVFRVLAAVGGGHSS